MPNPLVSATLTQQNKTDFQLSASEMLIILSFLVNLSPTVRRRLRKMATKRAGYVNDVFAAVMANLTAIPETFDITQYKNDKQLADDMLFLINILRPILEGAEDTLLVVGNQLMTYSDTCYTYLKRAAKDNLALTETVAHIATAYKRKAAKAAIKFTLPAGGATTVEHVVGNTRLVNIGTTVIKYKVDNELTYTVIEPGDSELIATGTKTVTVANVSITQEGIFSIRLK